MLRIKCLGSFFRGIITLSPLASSSDSRDYHVQAEAGGAILRSVSSVNLSLKIRIVTHSREVSSSCSWRQRGVSNNSRYIALKLCWLRPHWKHRFWRVGEVVSFWFTATHSTGSGTRVAVTIMLILMNLLYIANFHTQALCTSPAPALVPGRHLVAKEKAG